MLKSFQGNVLFFLGVMQQTSPRATATSREGVFSPYSCLYFSFCFSGVEEFTVHVCLVWTELFFVFLLLFL